jgi:predicted dienelactone hydrolase
MNRMRRGLPGCDSGTMVDSEACRSGISSRRPDTLVNATAMSTLPATTSSLKDERVRAIVALAPTGVPLTAESLATVSAATLIYEAELDRFLVPRFHAEWVASHLPAPNLHRVPNAWHFAFMDTPSMPIPSPNGDVTANPPGFDRDAFLKQLAVDIAAFFDKALL